MTTALANPVTLQQGNDTRSIEVRLKQQADSRSPAPGTVLRLPDGRLVIYSDNPAERVICAVPEAGPEPERRRAWLWLVPAAAGVTACAFLCDRDRPRITPRPPALPPKPETPVPEPALLALVGAGLLWVTRRKK
jgi:hypothetical protein